MHPDYDEELLRLWKALDYLLQHAPEKMERGAVDENGDAAYSHLSQNVPGPSVTELQVILGISYREGLDPRGDSGNRHNDGAFGRLTNTMLQRLTGHYEYERDRDLPILAKAGVQGILKKKKIGPSIPEYADRVAEIERQQNEAPTTITPEQTEARSRKVVVDDEPAVPFRDIPVWHFCQADPRWAIKDGKDRILGNSRTFKRAGCAVTSCAMFLTWLHGEKDLQGMITPDMLDDYLDYHEGYQGDSLVWGTIGRYANQLGLGKVDYKRTNNVQDLVGQAYATVRNRYPVLLRVKYKDPIKNGRAPFNHFVLGVQARDNDIRFLDPGYRAGGENIPDNYLRQTTRKGGYELVGIDEFVPTDVRIDDYPA